MWGAAGMAKLWSAANVKLFGGNVDEEPFLAQLDKLIGDYNRTTASPGVQRGGHGPGSRSMSWQLTPTPILATADLRALPRDRAIAFAAGIPPVLIRPMYWWQTSWAADVRASIARYDPAAASTPPAAPAVENPWLTPARSDHPTALPVDLRAASHPDAIRSAGLAAGALTELLAERAAAVDLSAVALVIRAGEPSSAAPVHERASAFSRP